MCDFEKIKTFLICKCYNLSIDKIASFEYNGKVGEDDVIRFCTSWATKEENVDRLIETVKAVVRR